MPNMELSEDGARNRLQWDQKSDEYQAAHGDQLGRHPLAWGVWSIPEDRLHVLGEVRAKDVLELGCGGAQWSIALVKRGARCVGLDNSARQLQHARSNQRKAGVNFPLGTRGSAAPSSRGPVRIFRRDAAPFYLLG